MIQPADEQLLEQFRQWLAQTRAAAAELAEHAEHTLGLEKPALESGGLYLLAEEFTALRQEVKLQTRSTRGLEEGHEKLLAALQQSIAALDSIKPQEEQAAWSAGKSLALALAELDEALDRGRQQLERSGSRLVDEPNATLLVELDQAYASQSWLQRLLNRGYHQRVHGVIECSSTRPQRQALFAALIGGYDLIQQRLSRALAAQGILRIAAIGQVVDPEQMVVLEMVNAPGPPGVVVDEVRRGYTWNGRLLRCAEVRATGMA